MEHKFTGRFIIIIGVLLVGILGIFWPPTRLFVPGIPFSQRFNLKPGIDIIGGTSLTYEIQDTGTADENLSQRVADSLKKRVDPEGVRNLVWRPQGPTRLEIQMPISQGSGQAREARRVFARAQAALEATNIRVAEVKAALRITDGAQRRQQLEQLAMGSAARLALFERLGKSMQKLEEAEKAKDPKGLVDARDEIADIEREMDDTNFPEARLQTELELRQAAIDKATKSGKKDVIAAKVKERQDKMDQFLQKAAGFPVRQEAIKGFVGAFDVYAKNKGTVDDAEDLKRMLRGSGVLEFHIVVTDPPLVQAMTERLRTDGPTPKPGDSMKWFEVDRPDQFKSTPLVTYGDKRWILGYATPDQSMVHTEGARAWGLKGAHKDFDSQTGQNVVAFEFDDQGAALFGELSGSNLKKQLGIVLDDKMISAPVLQSRIESRGQISGDFSDPELTYLIRTLNAGSLPARLNDEPISERTVGPTLGADNLRAGLHSALVSVVAVAVFMIGYYYYAGLIATIAVVMNLIVNIGVLAMFNATFTLPGIAALALTVGMAVDANVLIFERLREEQLRGLSLRMALRNAYDRAFSAIFDSNVTTIATSVILYWYGSEEIRGFGLTLTIGIAISMFTALFVTRAIFDLGIERFGLKHLGSLPLSFPKWDVMMRPNIDWMGKAWIFATFSVVITTIGLVAYFSKGRDMYDIEFVSGTAVQVTLKEPVEIHRVREMLTQPALAAAQVVTVGNTGKEYEVVTPNESTRAVRDAVVVALGELLQVERPSRFDQETATFEDALARKVVLPIEADAITVDGFTATTAASQRGGVSIVLRNLDPPLTALQIRDRIERLRLDPGSNLPFREMTIDTPNRKDDVPTKVAVVSIGDPAVDYERDPALWKSQLARPMWKLVSGAITRPPDLGRVTSFNASVAANTKIDAIVAVLLSLVAIAAYVWARFGSFRFGAATIVALAHDVITAVGFIGMTHYVGQWWWGKALLIEPMRMNLTMIAALLTIMGYSVNDTIVVFDRIRENRGKFGHLSRHVINDSINQTLSRTLLTGLTTLATLFVMYVMGGPGIHGFTFALLGGILVGTYSSIAIASPLLLIGNKAARAASAAEQKKAPAAGKLQRA